MTRFTHIYTRTIRGSQHQHAMLLMRPPPVCGYPYLIRCILAPPQHLVAQQACDLLHQPLLLRAHRLLRRLLLLLLPLVTMLLMLMMASTPAGSMVVCPSP